MTRDEAIKAMREGRTCAGPDGNLFRIIHGELKVKRHHENDFGNIYNAIRWMLSPYSDSGWKIIQETELDCDECRGKGYYFIDKEKVQCICAESQDDE